MSGNYKITKSNIECYKLSSDGNGVSAVFTIDDLGKKGRLQIASDFGDWSYFWNGCGKPFKEFLRELGIDYVADKFREDEYFDLADTIKNFKLAVCERRRGEGLEKKNARAVYDEIKALEASVDLFDDFKEALVGKSLILAFFDWSPPIALVISPRFRRFWKQCWTAFVEHLKREASETSNEGKTNDL